MRWRESIATRRASVVQVSVLTVETRVAPLEVDSELVFGPRGWRRTSNCPCATVQRSISDSSWFPVGGDERARLSLDRLCDVSATHFPANPSARFPLSQ